MNKTRLALAAIGLLLLLGLIFRLWSLGAQRSGEPYSVVSEPQPAPPAAKVRRAAIPRPIAPYDALGACPFECCTYREWTVDADTDVLTDRQPNSPVAFSVKKGERVVGVTGVVVTAELGRAVVRQTRAIGSFRIDVKAGDELAVLNYSGEGVWNFWFDGRLDGEAMDEHCTARAARPGCDVEIITVPRTTWWVKIRTADGREGWSREPDHFGNKDRCA